MDIHGCEQLRFTETVFRSSRNLSILICHSASMSVYLLVILCNTRLYRQLVEIRSQVQPFLMRCVWLVRLDPSNEGFACFFTVTWQAFAENHVLQFST